MYRINYANILEVRFEKGMGPKNTDVLGSNFKKDSDVLEFFKDVAELENYRRNDPVKPRRNPDLDFLVRTDAYRMALYLGPHNFEGEYNVRAALISYAKVLYHVSLDLEQQPIFNGISGEQLGKNAFYSLFPMREIAELDFFWSLGKYLYGNGSISYNKKILQKFTEYGFIEEI